MANEVRLIDANALIAFIERTCCNGCKSYEGVRCRASEHDDAMAMIEDAPTVDAVPVVRCKDCRWARKQDHREPTSTPPQSLICQCFMHHHIPAPWGARLAVKPDDFCSYGERKDNGNQT